MHINGRPCERDLCPDFVWCLTGTPLTSSFVDLHRALDLLGRPSILDFLTPTSVVTSPSSSYSLALNGPEYVARLRMVMIRHTKSQRINGAAALSLPEADTSTIWLTMSDDESKLYHTATRLDGTQSALKCSIMSYAHHVTSHAASLIPDTRFASHRRSPGTLSSRPYDPFDLDNKIRRQRQACGNYYQFKPHKSQSHLPASSCQPCKSSFTYQVSGSISLSSSPLLLSSSPPLHLPGGDGHGAHRQLHQARRAER